MAVTGVTKDLLIDAGGGRMLRGREWPCAPSRGTIVLVHGLGEHVGRYGHVAEFLNSHEWRVVGFDHMGHGRSDGARGCIDRVDRLLIDLARVVDLARVGHKGPLVLVGHSLGGLLAARFASGLLAPAAFWSRPLDAVVLSSPVLDPGMGPVQKAMLAVLGPLAPYAPNFAVANGLKPEWISRDPAVVAAYKADPLVHDRIAPLLARFIADGARDVLAAAPRWNLPTLLLYAGADRCVRPSGSAAFTAAAPAAAVSAEVFPSLSHELFNEPERAQVLSRAGHWLDKLPLSPSRSPR